MILPETKFSLLKDDRLNLESQNKAENIPMVLPKSTIKMLGKSVQGLRVRKYRFKDKLTNQMYVKAKISS